MSYIGILILNYNNYHDTINCINSIDRFNTYESKILVVDNGSSNIKVREDVDQYLSEKYGNNFSIYEEGGRTGNPVLKKVTSYHLPQNYGYAVGNNKGLDLLYDDPEVKYVLLLNNDILFIEDMIPKLLSNFNNNNNNKIISPVLYKIGLKEIDWDCCRKEPSLKSIFIQHLFLCRNFFGVQCYLKEKNRVASWEDVKLGRLVQADMPSGSCMLFSKNTFKNIGSFDPNTFLYYEENILSQKFKENDIKVFIDFSSKCIHVGASTVKKTVNSTFSTKCWIHSCKYYLTTYRHPTRLYMIIMNVFFYTMELKSKIATFLRQKHIYK